MYQYAYRYPAIAVTGGQGIDKNLVAEITLEAYIARVEADGGTVEISNSLLLAFGMDQYYADWWWWIYRTEEDGGTVEGKQQALQTFKTYYS